MRLQSALLPVVITLWVKVSKSFSSSLYIPNLPSVTYSKEGTFNIGVLMPVHRYNRSTFCSNEVSSLGLLQRMEAIVFAVEEINHNPDLLNNHTLGFVFFDDCNKDITALAQTLRFRKSGMVGRCEGHAGVTPILPNTCENYTVQQHDVIGVIASESSPLSVQVANMLTAFKIPQISYMSSSPALSNKAKYPYFQRPIPSDRYQIEVILDLLDRFNWTFVSVLYAEGTYGTEAYNALKQEAEKRGICYAETYEINSALEEDDYVNIVGNLIRIGDKASVVIMFLYGSQARRILELFRKLNTGEEKVKLTFIASDAWGRNLDEFNGIEEEAVGAFSVNFRLKNVPRFDEHFLTLTPDSWKQNPWFAKYWEWAMDCSMKSNTCNSTYRLDQSSHYKPEVYASACFDTVYSYAYALDSVIKEHCLNLTEEDLEECVDDHLLEYLRNTSFIGETGPIKYDIYGDGIPAYEVLNFQKSGDAYVLRKVAHWNMHTASLNFSTELSWPGSVVPLSRCSAPCKIGEQQRRREAKCCWDCERCQNNQIAVPVNGWLRCVTCSNHTWPDQDTHATCVDIKPSFLQWHHALGIICAAVSGLGILVSCGVLVMYIINNQQVLIKACSRELSYIMLVGIILSYALVFTFIGGLTDAKCVVHLYGIGLTFTSMYGPLVTKTNRIYRIFQAGKRTKQRPPLIESRYQVIIALVIILVHAVLLTIGMALDYPRVQDIASTSGTVERTCHFPLGPFALALCYNMILVVACAFYAFKTRMLPDNYNESRFIAFCVYSTVFLWLSFVPVYFLVPMAYYKVTVLSVAVMANATVVLICMYIPKLFAIYCVKKEDLLVDDVNTITQSTLDATKNRMRFTAKSKKVAPIAETSGTQHQNGTKKI